MLWSNLPVSSSTPEIHVSTRASATVSDPALSVEGVHKRLGDTRAVDGVDLDVRRGEVVGLLGPNGAGKTTLLHLCAGLLAPDRGSIVVAGQRDPQRPRSRALLGFAPQATALYDELSVEENLSFFGRLHGLAGARLEVAVEEGLATSRLESRRCARVGTLSGGMRRRLHVATACVHAPSLLLLDEPTVGVDPDSRSHILSVIERLRGRGVAVVYASHHLDEIARLSDRVVFLAQGRVQREEEGKTSAELEHALSLLPRGHA